MPDSIHYELQYLDLMRRIWVEGDERIDRTGVGTRSLFGETMRFSLADDAIPLLTTKRVYWKTALREMLWFLTGDTNIRPLVAQGCGSGPTGRSIAIAARPAKISARRISRRASFRIPISRRHGAISVPSTAING